MVSLIKLPMRTGKKQNIEHFKSTSFIGETFVEAADSWENSNAQHIEAIEPPLFLKGSLII